MPKNLKTFLSAVIIIMIIISYLFVFKTATKTKPSSVIALPTSGINASNIGLLVKQNDPLSIRTAQYYQKARNIPAENIYYVDLPNQENMPSETFQHVYEKLTQQAGDHIQAYVATWQQPYRVDCMSITSALAFGYDKRWCQPQNKGCAPTPNSRYFNTLVKQPWTELKMRPTMLLTGKNFQEIESLILRGIEADGSQPSKAAAYLVRTTDKQRSTRWPIFKVLSERLPSTSLLRVNYIDARSTVPTNEISYQQNIMVYQTGLKNVPNIKTNQYLPGAIADHLTSFGGQGLSEKGQMKAFRWLEAGATGSYGTVVEPCNYVQKFPNPAVLIPNYLKGQTLIEAYWKSVQQPGEGLFIGEPLAKPYTQKKFPYNEN